MQGIMTLTWTLPVVQANNLPVHATEVAYRVKVPAPGTPLPFTVQDNVAPDSEQKLIFSSVAAGTYEYRITPIDTAGTRGAETIVVGVMPVTIVPLGSVTNAQAVAS